MQTPSVQIIQTQNISSQLQETALKTGDSVFVRVLQNKGKGSYVVSFAGNRFEVQSERSLEGGQSFSALLKVTGERLLVIPQNVQSLVQSNAPSSLESQLVSLGLPPSDLTIFLVQFFQQTGLRIDSQQIHKALTLAQRFPGKEKEAAEAALILKAHGIEPSEDAIRSLLASLTSGPSSTDSESKDEKSSEQKDDPLLQNDFIHKLYADGVSGNGKEGLLAFMNHLSLSNRHWLFLPFEWNALGQNTRGTLRLLLDTKENFVERMVTDVKTLACKYFFVLYYEVGTLSRVAFCTEPAPSDIQGAEEAVKQAFVQSGLSPAVNLAYDESAMLDGAFTTRQKPLFFSQEG